MKKIFLTLIILTFASLIYAQKPVPILLTIDPVSYEVDADSSTCTSYNSFKILFSKSANEYFRTGGHKLFVYSDVSTITTPKTPTEGDSDSLFVYYKGIVPNWTSLSDAVSVRNDSDFVTPDPAGVGLDFTKQQYYVYEMDLEGYGGVEIFYKWNDGTGALYFKFIVTR